MNTSNRSVKWLLKTLTTGVRFPAEDGIYLIVTTSVPPLGPTQPPIQLNPGVKRPEHKRNYLPHYTAEVKNGWSLIYTLPYGPMA